VRTYVLDTNAVVRYATDDEGAEKVEAILLEGARGSALVHMSVINAGEAHYVLARQASESEALRAINEVGVGATFEPVELEDAIKAARLKVRYKLGYADSFAAALALDLDATLVSADPAFEKLGKSLKRMKLPRHAGQ
jgi:ribonuclease VapC